MDDTALAQLIEVHQAELFRYVKYLGADQAVAEDVVQDAFLRAFRASNPPDLGNVSLRRSWLRRICHNLFIDHCRQRAGSPISFDSDLAEEAEQFWQQEFITRDEGFGYLEVLEHCLEGLPERSRRLIQSFYARRSSREEVAREFGLTVDGVKMALRRIRQALGDCIEKRLTES